MSEELAQIIANNSTVIHDSHYGDVTASTLTPDEMADAILAAGYRKQRQVTIIEELDALPDNSVIEDGAGDVGVLFAGNVWYPETAPIPVRKVAKTYLPVTVLHIGGTND